MPKVSEVTYLLNDLEKARNAGLITREEFEAHKNELKVKVKTVIAGEINALATAAQTV